MKYRTFRGDHRQEWRWDGKTMEFRYCGGLVEWVLSQAFLRPEDLLREDGITETTPKS